MEWINYIFGFVNILVAYFLLRETTKLRIIETEPELSIYLKHSLAVMGVYEIVVKNIGKGAAYNLHFSFDKDAEILKKIKGFRTINELGFYKGVRYMAPNQEYRTLFGGQELLAKPLSAPLKISVGYSNKNKKVFKEIFEIDPGEYWGTNYFTNHTLNDITDRLETIAKNISNLERKN